MLGGGEGESTLVGNALPTVFLDPAGTAVIAAAAFLLLSAVVTVADSNTCLNGLARADTLWPGTAVPNAIPATPRYRGALLATAGLYLKLVAGMPA